MTLPTLFSSPMRMVLHLLAQDLLMSSFQVKREIQRTPGMSSIFLRITQQSDRLLQTLLKAYYPFRRATCKVKRKTIGQRHWHTMDAATKVNISSCNLRLAANIFKKSRLSMLSANLLIALVLHMILRSLQLTLNWLQTKFWYKQSKLDKLYEIVVAATPPSSIMLSSQAFKLTYKGLMILLRTLMLVRLISTDGKQLTTPRRPQTVSMLTITTLPSTSKRSTPSQQSFTTANQPTIIGDNSASSPGQHL